MGKETRIIFVSPLSSHAIAVGYTPSRTYELVLICLMYLPTRGSTLREPGSGKFLGAEMKAFITI